ncbi:uncharacterized protein LOC121423282 [Lytechinus variegatus]|uniref:uncharacterized protein LOC121423282 n=1 Tax=Lytechinus variegatus TaxID=7654 RepID=UPI001BB258F7|nr:uncharacterized protein LOC121423282 [Lytechinus variegatus]
MSPYLSMLSDRFTILITIVIFLAIQSECNFPASSKIEGEKANLIFPYPCDSTEVTLQQSNRWPFYSSTEGLSPSLPKSQVQRLKVKNIINNGSCSLDLTIRDLLRGDQGTYILFAYKDGNILGDDTHRIYLQVDYPPGNASCVVGVDKGGDWVVVDCTANAGTIPGKIECYQEGLWMPPLTDPVESGSLLGQFILIRKSEPAFCCSSSLFEDKPRCECNDTSLNLDDNHSNHPCPLPSETLTTYHPSIVTENNPSNNYSTTMSTPPNKMRECNYKKTVITLSFFMCLNSFLLIFSLFCLYKYKMRIHEKK